jgi:D-alanine--poly(phosphoribitol) ligase subunit 1
MDASDLIRALPKNTLRGGGRPHMEGALRKASGRQRVAVVAWPRSREGNAVGLVAFVAGSPMNAEAIRVACQHALPPYMVPDRIEFLDKLPLNANGKIDYNFLTTELTRRTSTPV